MLIYLIRHGETLGNRNRIVQIPETPLSDRGLDQAARLGERLRAHPIRHILASDLARADMTARAVSHALGLGVESEPLLQERNFGDLRGTPYDELEEDLFGPDFAPPGGEAWEEFHERVDRAWQRICALAPGLDGHLAVVTHGLVLHSLFQRHLALPGEEAPGGEGGAPRSIGNTSLTLVEIVDAETLEPLGSAGPDSPGASARGALADLPMTGRVVLLGCTEHLDAMPQEGAEGITGI